MILKSKGISDFIVDKRIDVKATAFNFNLLSKYNPPEIVKGKKVQYGLKNLFNGGRDVLFNGSIEKVDDTIDISRRVFNVSGRNVAMYLDSQPIYFPCYKVSTGVKRTRSLQWLIERIRKGTGTKLGPEILSYTQDFSNDPADSNCFCGLFGGNKSRTDAIDWLLTRYGELNGKPSNWYQWWVDTSGYIRLLDTSNMNNIPTMGLEDISSKGVIRIKVGEDIQSVKNDLTVIGGEKNDIRSRVYDMESIRQYGRRVAPDITSSTLKTTGDVADKANSELKRLTKVIKVGEVTLAGFPVTECGLAIKLLFSERYKDDKFIITSIKHTGKPGNYQTVLGISTDKNVLVNPNLSDIIEQLIKANTVQVTPTEAVVTAVNTETKQVSVVPVGEMTGGIGSQQNAVLAGGMGGGGGSSGGGIGVDVL
ncbi:MAG: hypothetical protein AMQ22_00060 [Candidatus Methanofastidiosum methylothiophilum]|uniref:Phage late control gene D protein (GPD) n=1 Tax=Candidatus Methanofastidiosum methylothiophilum TaxID=1705564 RepID=A0A150J9H8_9EURY|nr:MAG: hypothetical protein AMQ22_00060 [Candidatus Methanofastidiosum methylthiophilus]